jgi:predicted nucleic acid-binding protein
MGVLIDTCIWIDVEHGVLSPLDVAKFTGTEPVYLSPVTVAELQFGAECSATEEIRQQRLAVLSKMRKIPALCIDAETGEIFGSLAAVLKKTVKTHRPRIQDLWLASQAIQHGFVLLTRNNKDFCNIPGLKLLCV